MSISLREAGAWAAGTTAPAPAIPASTAAGDIMLLFLGCKPFNATIGSITGWTEIAAAGGTSGTTPVTAAGTGSVLWKVFYREWQSGDANPSISITSGDVSLAAIKSWQKTGSGWEVPAGCQDADTDNTTTITLAMDVNPGITSGDMLDSAVWACDNGGALTAPSITATDATIDTATESPATQGTTALGSDLEASSCHAGCTAGTASAAPTVQWTIGTAEIDIGGGLVRLRESAGGGGTSLRPSTRTLMGVGR
jgi:hypothetical protein